MEQVSVTTHAVGTRHSLAASLADTFPNVGLIERQPGFPPVYRRTLMAAVNTLSKSLGLRPASVMVLDALLSCLPCNDAKTGADQPITPLTLLTVYASNETLGFRAKGIPERQLRRHLDRLEAVGLVARRDSSNGKRFPIQRGGKIVGAYGIDLSPLLARSFSLIELAIRHRDETVELRGLRAIILRLRLDCLTRPLGAETLSFVEAIQTVLRRTSLTLTQARALLAELSAILQGSTAEAAPALQTAANLSDQMDDAFYPRDDEHNQCAAADGMCAPKGTTDPSPETCITSDPTATDGQNDRHKKTPKSYSKKRTTQPAPNIWQSLRCMQSFYPNEPDSEHGLRQVLFEVGAMLRIGQDKTAEAIAKLGLKRTLELMDRIAERPDEIEKPEAYLVATVASLSRERVGSGQQRKDLRSVQGRSASSRSSEGFVLWPCPAAPLARPAGM